MHKSDFFFVIRGAGAGQGEVGAVKRKRGGVKTGRRRSYILG